MANGYLQKVDISNDDDAKKKVKREFFLTKKLLNGIIDDINEKEDENFSHWVYDACRLKLNSSKGDKG